MKVKLSDHFNFNRLFRFVMPSMIMMAFTAIYSTIDDGLFVSNFVGKDAFVAINLLAPLLSIIGAIGFMLGTGGSALVSKTLGEGKKEEANEQFSFILYFAIFVGIIITILGYIGLRPLCSLLGAENQVLENCIVYGNVLLPFITIFMIQNILQSFLITAENPKLAMLITILSGGSNIIFDILLIVVLDKGLLGAGIATCSGMIFGSIIPLIYFVTSKKSLLRLTKLKIDWSVIKRTCINGISEFMTNISMGIVNVLYNFQLIKIAGDNGVASYGVIMYISFIFTSLYLGYANGITPVVGYNYGAKNEKELKNLFKKSIIIISILGYTLTILAFVAARPLSKIFVSYDSELLNMTVNASKIFAMAYLFMGINIFGSTFFVALNNGLIAGMLSFMRTLIFQVGTILILPIFIGINGVWWSLVLAEILALIVTIFCFYKMRNRYKH